MKVQVTLRTRLVMLVIAAIVPLFGLSIFKAWVNADTAITRARGNLQFAASLVAANQERMVDSAHQILISITSMPGLTGEKSLDCQRYFNTLKDKFSVYANLGIVGADGYVRCHGLDSGQPAYLGDRDYFRAAVARRSFVAGEYIVGRLSGKPSITFALPMLDGDGRVTTVAYASVDLAEMARSVAAIQLPPGAALGIHDRNGTLLAGKPELPIKVGQKMASPVLREAVKAMSTGVREGVDGAGQQRLWAFMPSSPSADAAFFVAISVNRERVVGPGQRQLWLELAVLALVAFLGAWIAWMMGGRAIVKPATEILDATRLLQNGRLDVRIPMRSLGNGDEFAKIADGFNAMAESLQQREQDLEAELARSQQAHATLQRAADAASAITWHQTLQGTIQEVAEQARGVIGTHQAQVILTVGSDWAPVIHGLSLSEKYAEYRDLIEPLDGGSMYALVCEANRSIRLTQAELEAHPRWRGFGSHAGKHPAMRGWLAVPLVGRSGKNMGLLQLSDKYEGEFTLQDEYVALELAQLASIAIENAQLLEEVGRLNAGLEQKVAKRTAALARQEALFRALAERAPQVVWTANPNGRATYYNRTWFDLVGGEFRDWAGSRWLTAIHPEDLPEVKASWQLASASRSQYESIRRLRARDGSYHTMSSRATPVLDERGELAYWVGIDADVTEIKAIEAALRLSNQELEAFSYSVSHDLRSPLNTIDGFSRLLAKQLPGTAGEKGRHYLSRIQAGVAQMGQLIEDLLSLAQVSRAQLRAAPMDLSALSRRILDEWRARDPDRRVAVHVESGLQAHGDSRLVGVVMENLLSNAWKFTSHQAQASISVSQKPDAAGLPVFFVRDNGAGFDMAYADKLFNPFQRLHAATEFAGTGIGLASASRVISRHGGRLWAESAPGCGATFFFTLPRVAVSV